MSVYLLHDLLVYDIVKDVNQINIDLGHRFLENSRLSVHKMYQDPEKGPLKAFCFHISDILDPE